MKVEIYDPPMCCSSGLCGPSVDPVLVRVNDAVLALKKQGIERFDLPVLHFPMMQDELKGIKALDKGLAVLYKFN